MHVENCPLGRETTGLSSPGKAVGGMRVHRGRGGGRRSQWPGRSGRLPGREAVSPNAAADAVSVENAA